MPGNRLSFPVRVGCQINRIRLAGRGFQFLNQFFLALDRNIVRGKSMLQIHTHGGFGQIPQMSHAGFHGIVGAKIFSDGLCLGGGLHNDQIRWF